MLTELKRTKIPVDDRLLQPKFAGQRIAILAIAIAIFCFIAFLGVYFSRISDPYVQKVLSQTGDPSKGQAIFQINCAGCHQGITPGSVGPNLKDIGRRKSKVGLIYQVTSGQTPPMPKFQPSPEEMADLLSYLERL
ncbi:MAG: c-type cytochrome [Prochloraceae cyanobacterium]